MAFGLRCAFLDGVGGGTSGKILVALMGAAVLAACASSQGQGFPGTPAKAIGPMGAVLPAQPPAAPLAAPVAASTTIPTPPPVPGPTVDSDSDSRPPPPPPAYLAPGVHDHQMQIDAYTRRWSTVVPPRADGTLPTGLVVVLHGVGGRGSDMRSTGFEPLAVAAGSVVVYPDAVGGAWNDGRPGADPVVPGVDDVRFLRLLIEEAAARTGADPRRVAIVGFSNGAVMAGRVACELADRVAAVAVVGGTAGQGFEQSCRPARPVAMMVVAGSNDRTVPYAGGRVADWGARRRGFVAPVDDFFAFWRAQAGCASTQPVPALPQVSATRGTDCRAEAAVVRYRVNGGGHEWFRPPGLDTTNVVWDFVTRRFATAA